jgi:hypothetical protein
MHNNLSCTGGRGRDRPRHKDVDRKIMLKQILQKEQNVGISGRPGRSFCITISPVLVYKEIREDFVEWFEGVESYCVGVEKHHTSGRYHLHVYIKFLEARDTEQNVCIRLGKRNTMCG